MKYVRRHVCNKVGIYKQLQGIDRQLLDVTYNILGRQLEYIKDEIYMSEWRNGIRARFRSESQKDAGSTPVSLTNKVSRETNKHNSI